jgi:hypothetical protein
MAVKKKTTAKKRTVGSGIAKYQSFIKRDRSVSASTKKIKDLESKLKAEKKKKASAVKKAASAYKKKNK